jgi:hypothetical protein
LRKGKAKWVESWVVGSEISPNDNITELAGVKRGGLYSRAI